MQNTDVAIVGAGPIGLEVAIALRQAGVATLHFDAAQVGATIQWWAPGTRFFSSPERLGIAGIPVVTANQEKATREEYLAYLRQVVQHFKLPIRTYERITAVEPRGDGKGFLISTRTLAGEQRYSASRVVLAIGDMHRPRMLNIAGEDLPHVSHYLGDPHEYFNRRVLIVGGRNSAVEAAIRLYRAGAQVTISHRRAEFDAERIKYWLLPEIRYLIKTGAIKHYPLTIPRAITLSNVTLGPSAGAGGGAGIGEPFDLETDCILALTGYEMDTSLLESAGVELVGEGRMPQHNPRTMETNIPGLFVAGTASAGTQHRFKVFIENSHVHAAKIVAAITGRKDLDTQTPTYAMPES
jgi:thioredoxin reductase (NADPH)